MVKKYKHLFCLQTLSYHAAVEQEEVLRIKVNLNDMIKVFVLSNKQCQNGLYLC